MLGEIIFCIGTVSINQTYRKPIGHYQLNGSVSRNVGQALSARFLNSDYSVKWEAECRSCGGLA
jgi:hypothetical protein